MEVDAEIGCSLVLDMPVLHVARWPRDRAGFPSRRPFVSLFCAVPTWASLVAWFGFWSAVAAKKEQRGASRRLCRRRFGFCTVG
eukprot:9941699-Lingulodinium_polyedra.AAC.1